jgi:hypothetical protein
MFSVLGSTKCVLQQDEVLSHYETISITGSTIIITTIATTKMVKSCQQDGGHYIPEKTP